MSIERCDKHDHYDTDEHHEGCPVCANEAMNDLRTALESAAITAALDLFGYSQSAAFLLPIPNTSPPLYLACGETGDIAALLRTADCHSSLPTAKKMADDYVAWLRYKSGNDTTIHLCDSDAPGAFKVYRHPSTLERENARTCRWRAPTSCPANVQPGYVPPPGPESPPEGPLRAMSDDQAAYVAQLEEALFEVSNIALANIGTYGTRDAGGLCGYAGRIYNRVSELSKVNRRQNEIFQRNGELPSEDKENGA